MNRELDFKLLFEASPDILLVLLPDAPRYTMVGGTRARFAATLTTPEQTIGRGLFELFPDNPDDPGASGTANLRASLDRVVATRTADTMAVQKHDIRGPDGVFQAKYWSPRNLPVLSDRGELLYILHRVEDVTALVRASEAGEALRGRNSEMEREVIARSGELAAAIQSLREANAKLGELDAAKTAFFSNVSHEFRTPLTLMLGPLEDALADTAEVLGPRQRTRFSLAYDNALRLLKLVNALLDFSRLEAGRLRATYAPLDIATLTGELAGMFQSAVEKAGIRLVVDCPPLSGPVWVDRDMWEKIVPNLVSNAFKFTVNGQIVVKLREEPERAVLEVSDTGVGIAVQDVPRVFERFYRATGAAGRTHEGTGIGLSLVHELVQLHGGDVSVESVVGEGTTFRVAIPKGSAHLPTEAVSAVPAEADGRGAIAYAVEAARWAGDGPELPAPAPGAEKLAAHRTSLPAPAGGGRARVLVVDDNADLRRYIAELLGPIYDVTSAVDGQAAVEALRDRLPDIVVSDVMMPRLDGFGLVRALRRDPRTARLPVILLSARAGEEATVEGLDAGADDFLVKPFSARELLARVRTHVAMMRARQAWSERLEHANRELDAFSYSVSHDLRTPLRAIGGFARMLAEDHGKHLDGDAQSTIERICRGVDRMSTLIDALLDLARIGRAPVTREAIDLSAIATAVVDDLRRASPDRRVAVDIAPGLLAKGDRRLLDVVLANLIRNAWKYSARADAPRIEVGRVEADVPTFFVRDNGAGFDMKYAKKLFAPFQRLHTDREFEGTGVGLATVQRAIARHGGRIQVDAAVNQGATFSFTVPEESPQGDLEFGP